MKPTRTILACLLVTVLNVPAARADDATTQPAGDTDHLAHIHVDLKTKQVAIDCQALNVNIPLEFFCVTDGGNEHESVLRTPAKPSDIHFALLMLGLTPGSPATFDATNHLWIPPHGPPLHITCKYSLNGKAMEVPAYRMMRSLKSKKEMPPSVWVFDGSRVMPDGVYAADITGYVVSICNFDLTLIDVPTLVSNANETLEWEYNPDLVPPKGTDVTMVIEPARSDELPAAPAGISPDKFNPGPGLSGMSAPAPGAPSKSPATQPGVTNQPGVDPPSGDPSVDDLRRRWDDLVASKAATLRDAAEAHYQLIAALRQRQQRLIDQSDAIQRTIDDLEKQYQDMTSPHPPSATEPAVN